jgi:hypothetical protein
MYHKIKVIKIYIFKRNLVTYNKKPIILILEFSSRRKKVRNTVDYNASRLKFVFIRVHVAHIQMNHSVVICTVLSCLMFYNFVLKFKGLIVDYISK